MLDWIRFRRWNNRPADDDVAVQRRDNERNRQAHELVGTKVFRETWHEELDDLVDAWLAEKDSAKAERLRLQAQELMAIAMRLQARAQRHHDKLTTTAAKEG